MIEEMNDILNVTENAADFAYRRLLRYAAKTAKAKGMTPEQMNELNMFYLDSYFRGQYKPNRHFAKFMSDVKDQVKNYRKTNSGFLHPKK